MRPEPFERLTTRQYAFLEDFAVDCRKFGVFKKLTASATTLDFIKMFEPLLVRHPETKSTQLMRNCSEAGRRNVLELTKAMNNAFAESHVVTFDRQRPSLGSEQHKYVITHMQSLQCEVKKVKEPVNWSSQMQNLCRCPETHYRQAPGRRERARACTPIYKHKGIFKWATPSRSDHRCVSLQYVNLYNTNIKYSRFKYSRRKVTNILLITNCVYRHRADLDINFLS